MSQASDIQKETTAFGAANVACMVYSQDRGSVVYSSGNVQQEACYGLGIPLLLYRTLKMINMGFVKYEDDIVVDSYADKQNDEANSLGVCRGETVKLLTLFSAVAATNAPDAAVLLARHLSKATGVKSLASMKKMASQWGLPDSSVITVSGRNFPTKPQQRFSVADLLTAARQLLSFDARLMLRQNTVAHRDRFLQADSILDSNSKIVNYICLHSNESKDAVAMAQVQDETLFVAVLGAKTPFERDSTILNAVYRYETSRGGAAADANCQWIQAPGRTVTLCGDTYFGEWYTKNRIKHGIDDPLQQFNYAMKGYTHSLDKVKCFFDEASYNLVNYEAVLTPMYQGGSQNCGYTDFSLGGDPGKSTEALKAANVNAVLLANNHMMDYGVSGCRQTIEAFRCAGIQTLGAGRNVDEAEHPVCLEMGGKRIILFNGYWYMERRNLILKYYAAGDSTGLACMGDFDTSTFWERIASYRKLYPDALIVLAAHWGYDFSNDHKYMKALARRAIVAGADCIIGSGPHMVQGCEWIENRSGKPKLVLYSLGHFVFNTTGRDFDKNNVLPYGLVAKLVIDDGVYLRLYPIYVNNRATFWQPHPVSKEQMQEFMDAFPMGVSFSKVLQDHYGYYITVQID